MEFFDNLASYDITWQFASKDDEWQKNKEEKIMAISTYKVFLMQKNTSTNQFEKLVNIKATPDLIGQPEQIEVTTMSDRSQKFIPGVEQMEALVFTCNYTKEAFKKLWDMRNKEGEFAVFFGGEDYNGEAKPTGQDGVVTFKGTLSPSIPGGAVNEVVEMTVNFFVSSELVWYEDASVLPMSTGSLGYIPSGY